MTFHHFLKDIVKASGVYSPFSKAHGGSGYLWDASLSGSQARLFDEIKCQSEQEQNQCQFHAPEFLL